MVEAHQDVHPYSANVTKTVALYMTSHMLLLIEIARFLCASGLKLTQGRLYKKSPKGEKKISIKNWPKFRV